MALQGLGSVATTSSDESSKKVRKPYTITKSRESWTEQEHDKFLEALQLFDRDWKKIEAFVGSKTVIQIRSHAQKYFLKVQKNGTSEHVPPPRPKRKAAHPYPQKASKYALLPPNVNVAFPSSHPEPAYILQTNLSPILRNSSTIAAVNSWANNTTPSANSSHTSKDDARAAGPSIPNNCSCSSRDSSSKHWAAHDIAEHGNEGVPLRGKLCDGLVSQLSIIADLHVFDTIVPDFSQVYTFLGSVFDPSTTGHLQKLKAMDPVDIETILLLMGNLIINLSSPEFEDHKRLLSSYRSEAQAIGPSPVANAV